MVLLLDTSTVPVHQRAELFQATVSGASTSNIARFENPGDVRAVMRLYDFGAGRVFNVEATGNTLVRTPRIARADSARHTVALALPVFGRSRMEWGREEQHLRTGDMLLVDMSEPYEFGWSGGGSSYAFQVDLDVLDLPVDTVHSARGRLQDSPLYRLVRDHVERVTTGAEQWEHDAGASDLAAATVDLMRALIVSVAGTSEQRRSVQEATLETRVRAYVRAHARERDLGAARIAATHAVSVRQLYRVLAAAGVSLEQLVLAERLEGARRELTSPAARYRPVSAVARAWGFDNPSFFAARFRRAYGMTPSASRRSAPG